MPGEGKVLLKKGQPVSPEDVLARVEAVSEPLVFDLPRLLKAKKPFSSKHLLKKPGEKVKKGDRLVCLQSFLFGKRILIAPSAGQIEELKESSGKLVFRPALKKEISFPSLFWGEAVKVGKKEVTIKTQFSDVFGVLGSGQASGELILGAGEGESSEPGIFVFQESPGRATLEKLKIRGAVGVICGGVHWRVFESCRRRGMSLLVTEGLGRLKMGDDLWSLFQKYQGRLVLLDGEKKRLRIPLEKKEAQGGGKEVGEKEEKELKKGDRVRLTGEPGPIGIQGQVVEVAGEKARLDSGFKAVVVKVKTEEEALDVPLPNLEILAA